VFGIDESAFKADLCGDCKLLLREALDPFIKIASSEYIQIGPAVRKALDSFGGQSFTAAKVREWCHENGVEVSATGLIRRSVIDAYKDAHGLN